jgi:Family of unknown function (DUF5995)
MNSSSVDQQLRQALSGSLPVDVGAVTKLMNNIDGVLPNSDGLKWFNTLYLLVTNEIAQHPPANGWKDAAWVTRLEVVFAGMYFGAIKASLQSSAAPASWSALFQVRRRVDIDRIQFALAGMNAHINHDLSLALLQTDAELGLTPDLQSPEHDDFEHVNGLLDAVLPSALKILATGIVGELAQDTGKIGRLLTFWDIQTARDLAWDFADHIRGLNGLGRDVALTVQDKVTGALGRSLLFAI